MSFGGVIRDWRHDFLTVGSSLWERPATVGYPAYLVYQIRRSTGRPREVSACPPPRYFCASFGVGDLGGDLGGGEPIGRWRACRAARADRAKARPAAGAAGARSRFIRFDSQARSRSRPARWVSSNAQTESLVFTCTVPSRATRAGHAFLAIAAPTAAGQRSARSARSALPPSRASWRRKVSESGSRAHLHDLARIGRIRRAVGRRDHRLARATAIGVQGASRRRRPSSSEEDAVAQRGQQRAAEGRSSRLRPGGGARSEEALLALRAEVAELASLGRDRGRADAARGLSRRGSGSDSIRASSASTLGTPPSVGESAAGQAELCQLLSKPGRQRLRRLGPCRHEPCARVSQTPWSRARRRRAARRRAGRDAAPRSAERGAPQSCGRPGQGTAARACGRGRPAAPPGRP